MFHVLRGPCHAMKVLEYTAKSFYDLLRLRATKHLSRSDSWLKDAFSDKTNDPELYFQKYFALSPDQGEDEILEVLAVNYFSESNCGLVKFWRLENEHVKGNCRLRSYDVEQSLMKAAKIALDKGAQMNQYQDVCEVFCHVTVPFNSSRTKNQLICLYDIGFRLVETELHLNNSLKNKRFLLLVYKPLLLPDYHVENGTLPRQIQADVIIKYLKDLLAFTEHAQSSFKEHHVKELSLLMRNLEKNAITKVFVRSSFPWYGKLGPSDNQVAVIGGGMAGLAAAAALSEAGFDVILLEASNYLGGRVKQVTPFKGFAPIDLGGEFIHGSDSIINRLARENGWPFQGLSMCNSEKKDLIFHKGILHPLLGDHPDIKKAWEAWDEIIMLWDKADEGDCSLQNLECSNKTCENTKVFPNSERTLELESDMSACGYTGKEVAGSEAEFVKTRGDKNQENQAHVNSSGLLKPDGDMTILEWMEKKQYSRDVIAVLDAMYCQTAGAKPTQMGVMESSREENAWEYGEGNYRLEDSYSKLVAYFIDKCTRVDKRLCWQVKEIDWRGINLETVDGEIDQSKSGGNILLKNQLGKMISANYVVVTVPLTILKDGDINFIPSLPEIKRKAIDTIQMTGALKIVCRFKSKFWPDDLSLVYAVGGFISQIWMYSRDSLYGADKCHVIAGFQTAQHAEEKISLSGKEVLDGFLQQLNEIFSTQSDPQPATDSLMDYIYYHWSNHPFIRGGYSSPTVFAHRMRHALACPVQDHLFFAGEATSLTACATVHTAMETGFRAAKEICNLADGGRLNNASDLPQL